MTLYPIQVNVCGKRCIVVGAGHVAARKAAGLQAAGAEVVVVAPEAVEILQETGKVTWIRESYRAAHLDGAFLAFAATNQYAVNAQVTQDAQARGVLVCDVSAPEAGDFVSPSTLTRGVLMLTVSTGGGSPTLAAVVREMLAETFGPEWDSLAALVGQLRPAVQAAGGNDQTRRQAVRHLIKDAQVRELLMQNRMKEAEARARECLSSFLE